MSAKVPSTVETGIAKKFLFWFGVTFTIAAPIYIGIVHEDSSTSWVAALCGAFIIFVSKLEDLTELSMGPVRAKMRQTIQEANATIEQVQKIAENISGTTLTALMAGNFGFRDGLRLSGRLDLHDRLIESLREIGLPEERVLEVDNQWRQGIGVIYHRIIAPLIDGREEPTLINPKASEEQKDARKGWDKLLDFEKWESPTPNEMKTYLESKGFLTSDMSEWIDDYRHYLKTREIRRREIFVTK